MACSRQPPPPPPSPSPPPANPSPLPLPTSHAETRVHLASVFVGEGRVTITPLLHSSFAASLLPSRLARIGALAAAEIPCRPAARDAPSGGAGTIRCSATSAGRAEPR
ncbi:hypothetical protein ABPG75_011547 [Micractinium tetrahymenae]